MRAFVTLIVAFAKFGWHCILRNLYWLYRLCRAHIGSSVSLQFPLKIEGRGDLVLGDCCAIRKGAELGTGRGGRLELAPHSVIDRRVVIRVGEGRSFRLGSRSKIEEGSQIYVNGVWKIGGECAIASNCGIFAREPGQSARLEIGDGTHIGDYTIIDVCDDVIIGKDVAIGPSCIFYTHDHDHGQAEGAVWKGPLKKGRIIVGNGAWVGARVTVLPGVSIGERAVIAAGAVVTKDVPTATLVAGIPAEVIKRRRDTQCTEE